MSNIELASFVEIKRVVEAWAVLRDAGQFDRLLALYHDDGQMMTTWAQVSAPEFVRLSTEGWERGINIHHMLGGTDVDIVGDRSIAQTKVTIRQRAMVDGVECDAVCDGRFYDFFERRAGAWKIVVRQPIYERDRLDPVKPDAALTLDDRLLASFPAGYRHLAYLQTKLGMTVKGDMPGLRGAEIEAVYARGKAWLAGEALRSAA